MEKFKYTPEQAKKLITSIEDVINGGYTDYEAIGNNLLSNYLLHAALIAGQFEYFAFAPLIRKVAEAGLTGGVFDQRDTDNLIKMLLMVQELSYWSVISQRDDEIAGSFKALPK